LSQVLQATGTGLGRINQCFPSVIGMLAAVMLNFRR
jgi:hypothetical protein